MMASLKGELFSVRVYAKRRHYSLVHVLGYGLALLVLTVILSLVMGCGGGGERTFDFGDEGTFTEGEIRADFRTTLDEAGEHVALGCLFVMNMTLDDLLADDGNGVPSPNIYLLSRSEQEAVLDIFQSECVRAVAEAE